SSWASGLFTLFGHPRPSLLERIALHANHPGEVPPGTGGVHQITAAQRVSQRAPPPAPPTASHAWECRLEPVRRRSRLDRWPEQKSQKKRPSLGRAAFFESSARVHSTPKS